MVPGSRIFTRNFPRPPERATLFGAMSAAGSRSGQFWLFLAIGVACLLMLNLVFAPEAFEETAARDAAPPIASLEPREVAPPAVSISAPPPPPALPAAARVPTIVARFDVEAKAPVDEVGIRALATAMIEDHEVKVVLEGHSDTLGADDFNHDLS